MKSIGLLRVFVQLICLFLYVVLVSSCSSKAKEDIITSFQLANYFRLENNQGVGCTPKFPGWLFDPNKATERVQLYKAEVDHHRKCKTSHHTDFVLQGSYKRPSACANLAICNSTDCLIFQKEASQFFYEIPSTCFSEIQRNVVNKFFVLNKNAQNYPEFFELDTETAVQLLNGSNPIPPVDVKQEDISFATKLYKEVNKHCDEGEPTTFIVEGIGDLPEECDTVSFCNDIDCFVVPGASWWFSGTVIRQRLTTKWGLDIPDICSIFLYHKITRRNVIPDTYLAIENDYAAEMKAKSASEQTFGILNFNLPGYRYCGPGTDVEKMDDQGGPINELDDLCREHDVAYLNGEYASDADAKLLSGLWELKHPLLPLFMTIFQAKRYFEQITGQHYTSSLYYIPESFQPSLTLYMSETSTTDTSALKPEELANLLLLEAKWKKQVHEIWKGYCYDTAHKPKSIPNNSNAPTGTPPAMVTTEAPPGPSGSFSMNLPVTNIEEDEQTSLVVASAYPIPPRHLDPCRVVINEVAHKLDRSPSFIELKKNCPVGKRTRAAQLTGYYLTILEIDENPSVRLSVNLSPFQLNEIKETSRDPEIKPNVNYYFIVGDGLSIQHLQLRTLPSVCDIDGTFSIPALADSTYAVLLLHFPNTRKDETFKRRLKLKRDDEGNYVELQVLEAQLETFKNYLQDVMFYGSPCEHEICNDILSWMPTKPDVTPLDDALVPPPFLQAKPPSRYVLHYSLNLCSKNPMPMQINEFVEGLATPGKMNECPAVKLQQPFKFGGTALQTTAQKMIVNIHSYMSSYLLNPNILRGTPVFLTSDLAGVSQTAVLQSLRNWKANKILTPKKKSNRPFPVQCQFDSFNVDLLKRIIQDHYAKNVPPLCVDVFNEFKKKMIGVEEERRRLGEDFIPFHCSEWTFRKVLHKLGFVFGKINLRDVILMRPDIVSRRGVYLKALRQNAALPNPLPVVYIDETWIDPHARTGKAWVPKQMTNYRERAKYSYHSHKVSRGPRIIVLSAGGVNGMIKPLTRVYPVAKKDASGDYHDNVDGKYFMSWFEDLCKELAKTGPHIIVMDNAPYHSMTEVVKERDRKAVIYKWLQENLPEDKLAGLLPERTYKKWELWAMVKTEKGTRSFYIIDKMALKYGHRVLRLPPYNCDLSPIELVWKDVKHEVRKQNVDQSLQTVITTAKKILDEYTAEQWKPHVAHVKRLEQQYWEQDGFLDDFMEAQPSLIIPIGSGTYEDDDDDSEDEDAAYGSEIHSLIHEEEEINRFEREFFAGNDP